MMELQHGTRIRFEYWGDTYEGTVISAGAKRVHVQSSNEGVYIEPDDVVRVLKEPDENRIPLLEERLRFSGGIGQR